MLEYTIVKALKATPMLASALFVPTLLQENLQSPSNASHKIPQPYKDPLHKHQHEDQITSLHIILHTRNPIQLNNTSDRLQIKIAYKLNTIIPLQIAHNTQKGSNNNSLPQNNQ